MTAIRIRFDILWTVPVAMIQACGPASHFVEMARRVLEDNFAADRPRVTCRIGTAENGDAEVSIRWDINLRETPGSFHNPEDHVAYITRRLVTTFKPRFSPMVSVETWRHASFSEAIDHGEIASFYGVDNTTKDDYPVFRPETHPDWPEANEVFLLEGVWWWSDTTEDAPSPAVGDDPKAIYARWNPEFRAQSAAHIPNQSGLAATLAGAIAGAIA